MTELTPTGWLPIQVKYQGQELAYTEKNNSTSITATVESSSNTVVTADAIYCDGSPILIEFYAAKLVIGSSYIVVTLFDDSTSLGWLVNTSATQGGGTYSRRLTPTFGKHVYSIRAFVSGGTGTVEAGAGGSGNQMPAFIRITRASGGT